MVGLSEKSRDVALTRLRSLAGHSSWQENSWQSLALWGIPTAKHEDWKYTPLDGFLSLDYREPRKNNIDSISFESISMSFDCYRLVFFDGKFNPELSDDIPNTTVTELNALDDVQQQQLAHTISQEAFSALTDATATAGIYIHIANNTQLDKPIYLFHLNSGGDGELVSYRHHVELSRLAECHIYEHHVSLNQGGGVTCARLTANVSDGASFEHIKLIEEGSLQHHFGHNDITLYRDSRATSHTFLLEGKLIRHNTSSVLKAEGGEIEMNSLNLPKQDQVFDTRTFLRHKSAHCNSHQTHKVIGKDNGVGVFNGMIYVDKGAIKTDGQMDNHNLLLSEKAQVNSKPQLEIYADDVKCSHGATTGQIDQNQVFYLQARGIPKAKAEKMITFAFAGELTDAIEHEEVRKHIIRRIEQKLDL
ncbi:Protein sufD [Vibrio nigripulchritudo MADA3029]|uniref:Protein sufD n=1 Tax=Vibrio nigripulchritudo TaxID=28173 RepID=U4K902_9VIBR|nr:Fe-S cluster assembly protein SufD [Vibrio nigripulchritudo]EGU57584.1 dufD protein [Vibrio nigripulchritudo ATCC 27043]CCN37319.1 Protein sufD [Vibrio nigripulchritudo AM115]CCN38917.1 Protein sufD [Vibrio nigripulchritudo FTn2]CCN45848.1 Protein sufD [Vibrio nigripulchritudo MADA3020]CCN52598.1 Protein sufD [Vibrio nigripulchritudo MADA3021]